MKLRVTGTEAECTAAVRVLRLGFAVREVSAWYQNRGVSELGRVYLEVDPPTDPEPDATDPAGALGSTDAAVVEGGPALLIRQESSGRSASSTRRSTRDE